MTKNALAIMLTASIVTAIGLSSCGGGTAGETSGSAAAAAAANVKITVLQPSVFEDAIPLTGIVKALDDVMISPEEGGVVRQWKVKKGTYVRKGDVLAVLWFWPSAAPAMSELTEEGTYWMTDLFGEEELSDEEWLLAQN